MKNLQIVTTSVPCNGTIITDKINHIFNTMSFEEGMAYIHNDMDKHQVDMLSYEKYTYKTVDHTGKWFETSVRVRATENDADDRWIYKQL